MRLKPGNPFPGMDPWLERHWEEFHGGFAERAKDQLQGKLPGDLRAGSETRVFVSHDETWTRQIKPDNVVVEGPDGGPDAGRGGGPAVLAAPPAVAEPEVILLPATEIRQRYLTLLDVDEERVVTVVEFLSPSNKRPGTGRRAYLRKQRECLSAGVNVVEIDLTRGGRRPMVGPPPRVDEPAYAVNVWREEFEDRVEFYRVSLRDRLPAFRIPLRRSDADVILDLQPVVDLAHENSAAHKLDHARPLDPPLPDADAAWAVDRLRDHAAPDAAPGPS